MGRLNERLAVYVVTDERADHASLLTVCAEALKGGAGTVQLRRKRDTGRVLIQLGQALRRMTAQYGALYIVNDRLDVALATDADGVHIGQDDIPLAYARRLMGSKIIGVSACTLAQARLAAENGADYLGVGAIFPTPSKPDADVSGLKGLQAIAAEVHSCPLIAIGGITEGNARDVLEAGAHGLAVVSAVMSADSPRNAVERFRSLVTSRGRRD